MDILDKIRKLQADRGWTDYKLCQEANISQSSLTSIFSRKTPPKIDMLQSICNGFGITLAQFFLEGEEIDVVTTEEKEILQLFRRLTVKQKRALIALLEED